MAISQNSQIKTLIKLGLIDESQVETWNKKIERLEAKQARDKELNSCISQIKSVLEEEANSGILYFSVKPASHSKGFLEFFEADRSLVLKALSKLVKDGYMKKVGLKMNDEGELQVLETSQVNAFQIRYMRA
tara:strand:- start:239 stop:634 length:396 start_codon:yes stop_codon:yes gene_type:complete